MRTSSLGIWPSLFFIFGGAQSSLSLGAPKPSKLGFPSACGLLEKLSPFCERQSRTQRRSDGTVSIKGARFELPSRLRTMRKLTVRYARWDLSQAWVVDDDTDAVLSSLLRPISLIDEAQEVPAVCLNEARILGSANFDSESLLTTVLAADMRATGFAGPAAAGHAGAHALAADALEARRDARLDRAPARPFGGPATDERRTQKHAQRLDPHCPWLQSKGIKPCTASRFEVGAWHGRGFLEGCVGVRLHDPAGRPLGHTGRRCDPRQAARYGKWKLPAGLPKRNLLYNMHRRGARAQA